MVRRRLIALLAACTRGAGGAGGSPHVLRIAYDGDPASLVPFVAIGQEIIDDCFDNAMTR